MMALRPGASMTLAVGATSATGATPTSAGTTYIRVVSPTGGHIRISPAASPVAATNADLYICPNVPEYFQIGAGSVKISTIQGLASAVGSMIVTEMS